MAMNKLRRAAARWAYGPGKTSSRVNQTHQQDTGAMTSVGLREAGKRTSFVRLVQACIVSVALIGFGSQQVLAQSGGPETRMTQAEINAMTDQTARQSAQWSFDKAKEWQTQPDGIERRTDLNAAGKERLFFTPQKLTAADCLPGRHWELIPPSGIAGCVCDGDLTHTRVGNNYPNACVVTQTGTVCSGTTLMNTYSNGTQTVNEYNSPSCGFVVPPPPPPPPVVVPPPPPPPPAPVITFVPENQTLACPTGYSGTGVVQTRQVTYTNGIPTAYGAWATVINDCAYTQPLPPPTPPAPVYITIYFVESCNNNIHSMVIDAATLSGYGVNMNGPYLTYAEALYNSGWGGCG